MQSYRSFLPRTRNLLQKWSTVRQGESEAHALLCAVRFVNYHGLGYLETIKTDTGLERLYDDTKHLFTSDLRVTRGFRAVLFHMRKELHLLHTKPTSQVEYTRKGSRKVKTNFWTTTSANGACGYFEKLKQDQKMLEVYQHYERTGELKRGYNEKVDYSKITTLRPQSSRDKMYFRPDDSSRYARMDRPYKVVQEADGRIISYYESSHQGNSLHSEYPSPNHPDIFTRVMSRSDYRSPPSRPRFTRTIGGKQYKTVTPQDRRTHYRNRDFSNVRSSQPSPKPRVFDRRHQQKRKQSHSLQTSSRTRDRDYTSSRTRRQESPTQRRKMNNETSKN